VIQGFVVAKHDCHGKSEAQSEQRSKDSRRFPPESYDQEKAKDERRDGHSPSQGTGMRKFAADGPFSD
jgi:hypothetical protein